MLSLLPDPYPLLLVAHAYMTIGTLWGIFIFLAFVISLFCSPVRQRQFASHLRTCTGSFGYLFGFCILYALVVGYILLCVVAWPISVWDIATGKDGL